MNIKYYLIHGIDKERGPRMISEFKKWGLDNENIKWMLTPNKDEITNEIKTCLKNNVEKYESDSRMLCFQLLSHLSDSHPMRGFDPQIYRFVLFPIAGCEKEYKKE
jgi:hypothetical protein